MFAGFEATVDAQAKKRWLASTGTSLAIYGVIGVIVAIVAARTVTKRHPEESIDVSFHAVAEPEPELKNEPPPPPPPKQVAAPGKRPGRKAPSTPTVIPEARPDEAEPTGESIEVATVEDFGDGIGGSIAPPPPAPPPAPPPPPPVVERRVDPIEEADDLVAPIALAGNRAPAYPEAARKQGREGQVVLKITVAPSGEVTSIVLVRGDEPFASAAIEAVRTWRYRPGLVDGKPATVARMVSIPFRIRS